MCLNSKQIGCALRGTEVPSIVLTSSTLDLEGSTVAGESCVRIQLDRMCSPRYRRDIVVLSSAPLGWTESLIASERVTSNTFNSGVSSPWRCDANVLLCSTLDRVDGSVASERYNSRMIEHNELSAVLRCRYAAISVSLLQMKHRCQ
jgi:hypothetical protein